MVMQRFKFALWAMWGRNMGGYNFGGFICIENRKGVIVSTVSLRLLSVLADGVSVAQRVGRPNHRLYDRET